MLTNKQIDELMIRLKDLKVMNDARKAMKHEHSKLALTMAVENLNSDIQIIIEESEGKKHE